MVTMEEIQSLSKEVSDAMAVLNEVRANINADVKIIEDKYSEDFDKASEAAAAAEDKLNKAIADSKALFDSPKTQVFYNVKSGLSKKQDKYEIADEEKAVELIKQKMPALVPALIHTKETVVIEPLKNFKAAELKELGIEFVKGEDEVTISIVKPKVTEEVKKSLKKTALKDAVK